MTRPFRLFLLAIAAIAVFPASAAASVRSTHSGWFWSDPTPQAQGLSAVEFSGSTGFASGDFGTLIRSTDAGRTWQGLATGLTEPLTHLRVLNANTVTVGGTCALRRSDDGGNTFRRLPWTASDQRCLGGIQAFDFPSSNVGYLVLGNGNVLRSGDAGRTWSRRTAIPGTPATTGGSDIRPTDVDFTSETNGFVSTNAGDIFWTIDGGNTWRDLVAVPWSLRSIRFPSANVGYAVGAAPIVLKTTDGGQTWNETGLPGDVDSLSEVRCVDERVCEGITPSGDLLVRTNDGFDSSESLNASTIPLHAVALPSAQQVVAVGSFGATVISSDGGASFAPVGSVLVGHLTGLKAVNASTAYAYGQGGAFARTINGGVSWIEQDAPTSDNITDISFTSASHGYVLDASGQLLLTTNAGDSYEILDTGTAQSAEAVLALDAKHVLLIGPAGLSRSEDGRTFHVNSQQVVRKAPLFDASHSGKTVVAYGPSVILLSRNGGSSFRRISRPSKQTRIDVISVASPKRLYLLDARGFLYRSDSFGKHWVELAALGTEVGYDMSFSDANHGWVSISEFGDDSGDGWVLRTADGGHTWEPQLIASSGITRLGLAAPTKNSGFLLDNKNEIFATHTAGSAGRPSKLTISSPTKKIPIVFAKVKDKKTKKLRFKLDRHGKKIRQSVLVRIHGTLKKARGGETVVVSYREQPSSSWLFQDVTVASSGSFTVVARVKYTTVFVAQWAGDDRSRGAGSPALRIVGPPVPKKKTKKH